MNLTTYISASMDFPVYGIRHILPQEAINKFQLEINLNMYCI